MASEHTAARDTAQAHRPRKTLGRSLAVGALSGALVGMGVAFILVYGLGAVEITGRLGLQAFLYLGFEAGFAGAILGGVLAGLNRLRNTR